MRSRSRFERSAAAHGMEEFRSVCCIRGYHVYKEILETAVGEVLLCTREPHNALDRYAVPMNKAGTVIGHLPRKLSRVCSLFCVEGVQLTVQ